MGTVSKIYNGLIKGLAIVAGLMLAIILAGIVFDVTLRTLGYNALQWYSAIAEYCLLFSTMLAAPWLVRLKGHVVVESLFLAMPLKAQWLMAKFAYTICIGLSLLFAYYGFLEMVETLGSQELDLRSIDMPKWILFVPFPLGFTLVAIEFSRYLLGYDTYYSNIISSSGSL